MAYLGRLNVPTLVNRSNSSLIFLCLFWIDKVSFAGVTLWSVSSLAVQLVMKQTTFATFRFITPFGAKPVNLLTREMVVYCVCDWYQIALLLIWPLIPSFCFYTMIWKRRWILTNAKTLEGTTEFSSVVGPNLLCFRFCDRSRKRLLQFLQPTSSVWVPLSFFLRKRQ